MAAKECNCSGGRPCYNCSTATPVNNYPEDDSFAAFLGYD